MPRLLLLIAIVAVAWYLYRRLRGSGRTPPPPAPQQPPAAMSACAECGVHAPEQEGVRYQTLFFCSPAHLEAYLKRRGPG